MFTKAHQRIFHKRLSTTKQDLGSVHQINFISLSPLENVSKKELYNLESAVFRDRNRSSSLENRNYFLKYFLSLDTDVPNHLGSS